jgi:hypothetical protein
MLGYSKTYIYRTVCSTSEFICVDDAFTWYTHGHVRASSVPMVNSKAMFTDLRQPGYKRQRDRRPTELWIFVTFPLLSCEGLNRSAWPPVRTGPDHTGNRPKLSSWKREKKEENMRNSNRFNSPRFRCKNSPDLEPARAGRSSLTASSDRRQNHPAECSLSCTRVT